MSKHYAIIGDEQLQEEDFGENDSEGPGSGDESDSEDSASGRNEEKKEQSPSNQVSIIDDEYGS